MPSTKGPDLSRFEHVIDGSPGAISKGKGRLITCVLPKGTKFLALRTAANQQKWLRLSRTKDDYLVSIRAHRIEEIEP